ncbi:MAG: phosphodiester glycosidase family protein [Dysgonomonas sp.]
MKNVLLTLLLLSQVFCGLYAQATFIIKDQPKTADTIEYKKIGPGVTYTKYYFPEYPLNVYLLTIDLKDDNNKINTFQAYDVVRKTEAMTNAYNRLTTDQEKVLGGVNGNFWIVSGQGQPDLIGIPHSGSANKGTMITDPNEWNRGHGAIGFVALDKNKELWIEDMNFDGKATIEGVGEYRISQVNRKRNENELVFFNHYVGEKTFTDDNGTEVFIKPVNNQQWGINEDVTCEVVRIVKDKGANTLNPGESVLSGNGTAKTFLENLTAGQQIKVNLGVFTTANQSRPAISEMVTGNAVILQDGVLTDRNYNESYNQQLYPRTGIGMSQDRKTAYLIVIDKKGVSVGTSTETMAEILRNLGAWNVTSMDGGGSAQMMLDGKIINMPADGKERPVANGWMVYDTAPEDNTITEIQFEDYSIKIPVNSRVKPAIYGYNQYKAIVNKNTPVTYSCDPALGHIDASGAFVASGTLTKGVLTAEHNGLKVSKTIEIDQSAVMSFRLDSVIVDNNIKYAIEVQAQTDGKVYPIDPASLSWVIDNPTICKIENGVLSGLVNGETVVTGTLGSYSDVLKVKVQIVDKSPYYVEKFDNMESFVIGKTSNLKNMTFSSTNLPEGWEHGTKIAFNYASKGRGSYVALNKPIETFSLPDSMYLTINPGNAVLTEISVNCSAKNGSNQIVSVKDIIADKDIVIGIALNQLGDLNDRAAYPFVISSISFYINDGKAASGTDMYLSVKDVKLTYDYLQTGIEDINPDASVLVVYPNPVNRGNSLTVSVPEGNEDVIVSVYSALGSLIKQETAIPNDQKIMIATESFTPGIYFVKVQRGNSSQTAKIIVK